MTQTNQSQNRSFIGQPMNRIDGPLKVSGRATYAYEQPHGEPLYGVLLGAGIGKGRIARLSVAAAEATPRVHLVMTHRNAPAQAPFGEPTVRPGVQRPRPVVFQPEVRYFDEPVALVVAESFEIARAATEEIEIEYREAGGTFSLDDAREAIYAPAMANAGLATDSVLGDPDGAFAAAPVKFDQTYTNAFEHHAPMEPHAAHAIWDGDQVTIYTSAQTPAQIKDGVANTLQIPPENVRVISPFIGGGFGSKLIAHAEIISAVLAARMLNRPVKVALTRQQMFANAGHRPMFEQRFRIAADTGGRLISFSHDSLCTTSRFEEFAEQAATAYRSMYAAPNRATRHRLAPLDINRGEWMRAPGEAPGLLAGECAMDELAEQLGIDPIEFRIRNEPERDPERNVPFSTRGLVQCMREGAQRFGWNRRVAKPASVMEGRKLIGIGMSAAIRPNLIGPGACRVRIHTDGRLTVELDMTDIGTGTYTILAQIAADSIGLPIDRVGVALGDTRFPKTSGSGGSWGSGSTGAALHDACRLLKEQITTAARAMSNSPLFGANAENALFSGSRVTIGDRSAALTEILTVVAPNGLSAQGKVERGQALKDFSQHTYGAHFAEVSVDADTGEIRLRRMLGVFAAGRILNPKTARSQIIGGMIWGVGAALMEEGGVDPRYGNFLYSDLANYHVPVQADIQDVDAVFLDEYDDKSNVFGSKGIGELGICGAGAALANAVYNATGLRIRSFPITLEKVLPGLPDA
ncbi:xanthine dehydrogenase YagR molybdenum-binding subunit [Rhizobium sullae]|uniref:Xanthine dehydrogenase YagR molybdenum-binding subunit n=2 Tax=Rhizobium sullae TaxID=50338 RepID=A0A4R3PV63_RHISU|nr:xanthine dehydrogenase family protein molybdopterin-binding subunit [Rhizobium sullae]TCU11139.1 xanthine dehydrogenase YagR molybdenum-binding subunit [Rhizobium sullae]